MRLNGARQCGASACSTPFALDPVSRSVSSRSWKASQKRLSSAPTKGSPGRCPRVGARASCAAATSRPRGRAPLRSRGPTARRTTRRRGERRRPPSSSVEETTPKVEPTDRILSQPENKQPFCSCKVVMVVQSRRVFAAARCAPTRPRRKKSRRRDLRDAKRVRLDRRRSPQIAPRAGFISPPRSFRRGAPREGFAGVAAGLRRAIPRDTALPPSRIFPARCAVPRRE